MSLKIKDPGSIACGASGAFYSGERIEQVVAERKAALRASGCGEGSAVALIQPNEAEFFLNLFAIWELGACAVPLSPTATEVELGHALGHSGASLVWRNGALQTLPGAHMPPPVGTALLLYTSGSTGQPKGVRLSFRAVEKKMEALLAVLSVADLERTLCMIPVSFGHGLLGNSLPTLWSGQTLHLEPAFDQKLALGLGAYLDTKQISFFSSVPALWKTVLPFSPPPQGASLRRVFCASAGLPVAEAEETQRWLGKGAKLKNVYGITEAASWIAGLPDGEPYKENGSFGKGWNCEFRIDGESGEILARAPYLMDGYHRDEDATLAALEGGWLRTGDLGEISQEGNLTLRGRLKDQINRGGQKVSPVEVEDRLRLHPSVKDACVFSQPDEVSGEAVVAAVTLKAGTRVESIELKEFCRESLSEYKLPERFYFLEEFPRSSRGKVNKAELLAKLGVVK